MDKIKKYAAGIVFIFFIAMITKPALCFVMIGLIFAILGVSAIRYINYLNNSGIRAEGKILYYETDFEGHKTPYIEFTTEHGQYIKAKPYVYATTDASIFLSYKNTIDQPITIKYDPKSPEKFVLADDDSFNFGVFLLFFLAGAFFVGLGICSLFGIIKMM